MPYHASQTFAFRASMGRTCSRSIRGIGEHRASFQNLIFLPLPKTHPVLAWIQFKCDLIPGHTAEAVCLINNVPLVEKSFPHKFSPHVFAIT